MLRWATPGTFWESGSCGCGRVMRLEAKEGGRRTRKPLTLVHAVPEEPSSDGGLALAQGQGVETVRHARVLCQLQQGTGGVHAGGQDEHQRGAWG